jgi:hypothetical protein
MAGDLYTVTIKYELRHTRGELVPSIEEVQAALEGVAPVEHDEISVSATQGQRFEGCRVAVDEVEVQEAKTR